MNRIFNCFWMLQNLCFWQALVGQNSRGYAKVRGLYHPKFWGVVLVMSATPQVFARTFFPKWDVAGDEWFAEPIGQIKISSISTIAGNGTAFAKDLGLQGGVKHFRLWRKNPGLALEFALAGSYGDIDVFLSGQDQQGSSQSNIAFRRYHYHFGLEAYLGFLRWQASLGNGQLYYRDERLTSLQGMIGENSLALRITKPLFLNWQTNARQIYQKRFDQPQSVEIGHAVYLGFEVDKGAHAIYIGPGRTKVQESTNDQIVAEGTVDTYQILSNVTLRSYKIFSNILYTSKSSDPDIGRYALVRIPQQNLNRPVALAAPADTLVISLEINQLLGPYWGLGPYQMGCWFNTVVFNYGGKDGKSRHTNRDFGAGFLHDI